MAPSCTKVHVLVAWPLLRCGIEAALENRADLGIEIDRCFSGASSADVIVADYECGMDLLGARTGSDRGRKNVLILTSAETEAEALAAFDAGALGYLPIGCEVDDLSRCLVAISKGLRKFSDVAMRRIAESRTHETLTRREMDVLHHLADGSSNRTVAERLQIAVGTVKSHIKHILSKLQARSRTEVVSIAMKRGLLSSRDTRPFRGQIQPDAARSQFAQFAPALGRLLPARTVAAAFS